MNDENRFREKVLQNRILNHLTIIRSNFTFGLHVGALIKNPRTVDIIRYHRIIVTSEEIISIPPDGSYSIEEGQKYYEASFVGPEISDFDHAATEFIKLHLRAFITEGFEKLRHYCDQENESDTMKTQPWYQFARMVRNSLKHNQIWNFNSYDRSLLPLSWKGKNIDSHMNGQEMTWSFFDSYDALELWDEMFSFAGSIVDDKERSQNAPT